MRHTLGVGGVGFYPHPGIECRHVLRKGAKPRFAPFPQTCLGARDVCGSFHTLSKGVGPICKRNRARETLKFTPHSWVPAAFPIPNPPPIEPATTATSKLHSKGCMNFADLASAPNLLHAVVFLKTLLLCLIRRVTHTSPSPLHRSRMTTYPYPL